MQDIFFSITAEFCKMSVKHTKITKCTFPIIFLIVHPESGRKQFSLMHVFFFLLKTYFFFYDDVQYRYHNYINRNCKNFKNI